MKSTNVQIVEKEQIKFLQFPKAEVLTSKAERIERHLTLRRAMALGNLEHEKVRLLFVDNSGFKTVETTIWGVTDQYVILKESTIIPLQCILQVS